MRCAVCGADRHAGAWTPRGWLCYICLDAYAFRVCVRCGRYFSLEEMRKWAGELYCKDCIGPFARAEVYPRPPRKAPIAVKVAPPKGVAVGEELRPEVVSERALRILGRKEERQKSTINQILMAIKRLLRGKEEKFEIK